MRIVLHMQEISLSDPPKKNSSRSSKIWAKARHNELSSREDSGKNFEDSCEFSLLIFSKIPRNILKLPCKDP